MKLVAVADRCAGMSRRAEFRCGVGVEWLDAVWWPDCPVLEAMLAYANLTDVRRTAASLESVLTKV